MSSLIKKIVIPFECRYLVNLIGEDAAFTIIDKFGGTRLYIPVREGAGRNIIELIGAEAMHALSAHLGGTYIKVPRGLVWLVTRYRSLGFSYAKIAQTARCSENAIHRILFEHGLTKPKKPA